MKIRADELEQAITRCLPSYPKTEGVSLLEFFSKWLIDESNVMLAEEPLLGPTPEFPVILQEMLNVTPEALVQEFVAFLEAPNPPPVDEGEITIQDAYDAALEDLGTAQANVEKAQMRVNAIARQAMLTDRRRWAMDGHGTIYDTQNKAKVIARVQMDPTNLPYEDGDIRLEEIVEDIYRAIECKA